jgi:hypothetical protein
MVSFERTNCTGVDNTLQTPSNTPANYYKFHTSYVIFHRLNRDRFVQWDNDTDKP